MSFSGSGEFYAEEDVEVVYTKDIDIDSSSEEPPPQEWSSLVFSIKEENVKRLKYAEGLYSPGSGEICSKYIAMSASSVLRHPYYSYPAIQDPGIKEALLLPIPKVMYADDGQELYLAICREMNQCPIRLFYKSLVEEKIDLRYYGINPAGFRAIAMALSQNRMVRILDLTDNWITEDGCFHLGEMLMRNITITELNLTGCRIGVNGARRLLCNLPLNRTLKTLNLSKNQLTNEGGAFLAYAIFQGVSVSNINLSYNNLDVKTLMLLSEVFETHNKLTHIDLSWNACHSPMGIISLCQRLVENMQLVELNLSWNSLKGDRIGIALKDLLRNPHLQRLILANNELQGKAIKYIADNLNLSKKLNLLDLSYNPLTPGDAVILVKRLKSAAVKLQKLLMENVLVDTSFMQMKEDVLKLKFRKNTVITYGAIISKFDGVGPDLKELVLNRAIALGLSGPAKKRVDMALIFLEVAKNVNYGCIDPAMFKRAVNKLGGKFDENLAEEFGWQFPGPRIGKIKAVNLGILVDYMKRKWPDKKLPPTPPPEPEPEPEPVKGKKGKGSKKKNKK